MLFGGYALIQSPRNETFYKLEYRYNNVRKYSNLGELCPPTPPPPELCSATTAHVAKWPLKISVGARSTRVAPPCPLLSELVRSCWPVVWNRPSSLRGKRNESAPLVIQALSACTQERDSNVLSDMQPSASAIASASAMRQSRV